MTLRVKHEEGEQIALAQYLDLLGVDWLHVPNEGMHKPQYYRKRAKLGVKNGAPDELIFTPPPAVPGAVGAAIELKRKPGLGGDGRGRATRDQVAWLLTLKRLGWVTAVCEGAPEAIRQLSAWGYGARDR